MIILFTGGGTLGPVTPLIAVMRRMREMRSDLKFIWAGTPDGVERSLVEAEGVKFYPIPVAKFPRYLTWKWLIWPWAYWQARQSAIRLIKQERPNLVVSMGGFTSVPVMRAAADRRIPCAMHQLDAKPTLSNVLVARFCRSVTTSFEYPRPIFKNVATETIPTPCRFAGRQRLGRDEAVRALGLDPSRPVVFVIGGGTGASALNKAITEIASALLEHSQIIHATGKGKCSLAMKEQTGYLVREFFDEKTVFVAYAAADVVVSRAGMGGISDLATFEKAAILVPIPGNQQEENAARMPWPVVKQGEGFSMRLLKEILSLLGDPTRRRTLGEKVRVALKTDDGSALAERWMGINESTHVCHSRLRGNDKGEK